MIEKNELPSSEDIEKWVGQQPLDVLSRLPDCVESREAKRLVKVTEDLAHQAREKRSDRS